MTGDKEQITCSRSSSHKPCANCGEETGHEQPIDRLDAMTTTGLIDAMMDAVSAHDLQWNARHVEMNAVAELSLDQEATDTVIDDLRRSIESRRHALPAPPGGMALTAQDENDGRQETVTPLQARMTLDVLSGHEWTDAAGLRTFTCRRCGVGASPSMDAMLRRAGTLQRARCA